MRLQISNYFFVRTIFPGSCSDSVAKENACKLLDMYEAGTVSLKPDHFSPSGNNPYDGASVLSNIRDTCLGKQGKRSS